jgi:SAM-dependent methyltransferase
MSIIPAIPANAPAINPYGALCAEVYGLDKPPGALGDISYYLGQLRDLPGPILEAGCGSGRLLIPLLEAGLPILGFDQSEHMLAQCRVACDARGLNAPVRRGRFQQFEAGEALSAIVLPVGTFTLIDDYDEALDVLRRFHAGLAPGGRLYIDLMPLGYLAAAGDSLRRWTTPGGDLLQLDSRRVEVDWVGQRRVTHDRYERWRGGRLVEAELEVLVTRSWSLKEFELTLRVAGFDDVSVCGDYHPGRAPRSGDRMWCFQARRAS